MMFSTGLAEVLDVGLAESGKGERNGHRQAGSKSDSIPMSIATTQVWAGPL